MARPPRPEKPLLAAADERHHLKHIPVLDSDRFALVPADDLSISLDRHSIPWELKLAQELIHRGAGRALRGYPVDGDREGHGHGL